ncbi:MAG: SRPBCC family protein [Acidobacteriota bacterium]|nr:MAG: SRPBCC family protein [Acidobacteriota bacterium]
MPMKFVKESYIAAPPEKVFGFHELPDAFERLIPPWENITVIQKAAISKVGSRAIIEQKLFGLIPSRLVAEHIAYDPPRMFEDVQISGPFSQWRHKHIVRPEGSGSLLVDDIDYEPPGWFVGRLLDPLLVRPKLEKLFEFRHKVTREWCEGAEGS